MMKISTKQETIDEFYTDLWHELSANNFKSTFIQWLTLVKVARINKQYLEIYYDTLFPLCKT